jgi:hypothetical protein
MITLQAQAAGQQALNKPVNVAPAVHVATLSDALTDLHESLHRTQRNATAQEKLQAGAGGLWTRLKNIGSRSSPDEARHQGALDLLSREAKISDLENQTRQSFAATEAHLKAARLPASILARHYAAVQQFEARSKVLHGKFAALRDADIKDDADKRTAALADVDTTLSQWEPKARQVDPNHLPWGSPSNKVRAPHKTANEFLQNLSMFGIKPIELAYNGSGAMPPGFVWPTLPTMGEAPVPGDTQPTEDVQITPAIQALATQLKNNPVLIYQWVRNNIRYIPTYGSIQGSDYTLQLKAGNDFDTASLLIALLRASNIPARYVYGTINVPTAQLDNWVGNVSNPDAAQNLLGQGGVPNVALTKGGQTVSVQMEHVWVEAFVNYVPSSGWSSKNPDTWVPLDASYKQYAYTAPTINLQQAVSFNQQGLLADAQNGATIDPSGNYVQGLNLAAVQTDMTNYQGQAQSYLTQQHPNATVGNVLGTQTIKPYTAKVLPTLTPYALVTTAADFDVLPATMRHYFVVQMYQDGTEQQSSQQLGQTPAFYAKISTPSLAGQQLALSFSPSTSADSATVQSYLPQPGTNGQIDPSQLPAALPGYAINVTPQLTVNGQVIVSADQFMYGQPLTVTLGYQSPNNAQPLINKAINAGAYYAIGLDMQGVSQNQLSQLQSQAQAIQTAVNGQQTNMLTKHDLVGVLLQVGVNSYFATNDVEDQIAARQAQVVANRFMSFGTFATNLSPNLAYGTPMAVGLSGTMMDIDHLQRTQIDISNNTVNTSFFDMEQGGRESANESLISGQLLQDKSSAAPTVQTVSGIDALRIAETQGQKIFVISQANIATVLPQLNQDSGTINDIQNSVSSGKIVTISQTSISYGGWTGSGYVITDPGTGASAYLIAGGTNGAVAVFVGAWTSNMVLLSLLALTGATGGMALAAAGVLIALVIAPLILAVLAQFQNALNPTGNPALQQKIEGCFWGGFIYYSGIVGLLDATGLIGLIPRGGLGGVAGGIASWLTFILGGHVVHPTDPRDCF